MSSISAMLSKLHAAGVAASARRHSGVIFQPDDSNQFLANLKSNLDEILYYGPGATKTAVKIEDDKYGMRWVVLDDGNFADLLSSTYTVANAMQQNGGSGSLLAATFHLDFASSLVTSAAAQRSAIVETYAIFRFDRNRYYPFIPDDSGDEPHRDSETEAQLGAAMRSNGLAIDDDRRNWLGLWDMPF